MSEESKKPGFDLAALDTTDLSEEGTWMHLAGPNDADLYVGEEDDEKPVRILLIGKDSKKYQDIEHKNNNKLLSEAALKGGRRPKNLTLSEDTSARNIEKLAKCTKAWENVIVDGAELECTTKNARMVYKRFPWIREQVLDFANDRSNYLGN